MSRRTSLGLLAGAGAVAALAASSARRWERAHDATDGGPLILPPGQDLRIPTHDGGELFVRVMGQGDQLFVLAHGWTSDHRVWAPVARRLVARGHRVAVYDQRGHGASRPGTDGLTVPAIGGDLASVLGGLDARNAVAVGHSMGGMAVQTLCLDHPEVVAERVRSIVLVASACDRIAMPGMTAATGRLVGSERINRIVASPRLSPYIFRSAVGRNACMAHIRAIGESFVATSATTRGQLYLDMAHMDLAERLRALDIPTTIMGGTHDLVLPIARSRRLAQVLPHARFETFPGAGHMLMFERADEVTELVEAAAAAPAPSSRSPQPEGSLR